MKYGIGLLASAVPTARTAAGCPISRAIQPYGRTWPRGISSVLCSTCCENDVRPRRSNRRRRFPLSWSSILRARSAGGSTRTSLRPTSLRNQSSNSAADLLRIAAETPSRFQATYTGPRTVSNTAYESAVPACASTRSANPEGAFTSPSRFRSIITVAMVFSSEHFQATMDIGLDRPHGLSERVRNFGISELLHMPQHHRLAVPRWQARDTRGELVDLRPLQHVLLRADPAVGLAAVELDQPRPHAPYTVADHVDRDPVQPGTLLELPDALGRVPGERFVGAQERVLRHIFGVVPVAGQRQPERVDPVLVVPDQALEDALRTFHRPPKHASLPPGCKRSGTMMRRQV